jgi:hypothetical protein
VRTIAILFIREGEHGIHFGRHPHLKHHPLEHRTV